MDRFRFLQGRINRLPPGFRFQPTDDELVFQYLRCKLFSHPLPASIIPELNPGNSDPWDLAGNNAEQERYFFSKGITRVTSSGYWKVSGAEKEIKCSSSMEGLVGKKRRLVFYVGKSPKGRRSEWVMHEYRLLTSHTNNMEEMEKWVLCHMFVKTRSTNVDSEFIQSGVSYLGLNNTSMVQEGGNLSPESSSSSSFSSNLTFIEADNNNEDTGCSYGLSFSLGGRT